MNNGKITSEEFDQWVVALRSGKYQQTKAFLRRKDHFENTGSGVFVKWAFCCLGVFADLRGVRWDDESCSIYSTFKYSERGVEYLASTYLPPSWITESCQRKLSVFNDDQGFNFDQIADWLEEHKEEVLA
jgi:hypothetical protein